MGLLDKIKSVAGTINDAIEQAERNKPIEQRNYEFGIRQKTAFTDGHRYRLVVNYDWFEKGIKKLAAPNPLYKISKSNHMGYTERDLMGRAIAKNVWNFDGHYIVIKKVDLVNQYTDGYNGALNVYVHNQLVGAIYYNYIDEWREIMNNKIIDACVIIDGGQYKKIDNAGSGNWEFFHNETGYTGNLYLKYEGEA